MLTLRVLLTSPYRAVDVAIPRGAGIVRSVGSPIVTDCGAIPGFVCDHNFSTTPADAVAAALNAGVSIDCG